MKRKQRKGTKPKKGTKSEQTSETMFGYWDDVFKKDLDSRTAKELLENIQDPNSLFLDEEFLHEYVDDIEKKKGVKNTRKTRWIGEE